MSLFHELRMRSVDAQVNGPLISDVDVWVHCVDYGVAAISRLLKSIDVFCKRAL